jgi:LysR family transcriptional regulator, glycine cleavage system transcriptional activator
MTKKSSRSPLPPFTALRAFEAVGRLDGIRRAAQSLGLNHAVVSRQVRALEEWAGARLIERFQGGTMLTEQGAQFHLRIAAAFDEITKASTALARSGEQRGLSIWCIPGFACQWLTTRLSGFNRVYPDIEIELHPTDEAPDFSRFEADIDIRYVFGQKPTAGPGVCDGVRRFEIARPEVIPVASPAVAAQLQPITKPADLLRAPLLHEEDHLQWEAWFASHGVSIASALRGPRLWHAHLTVEAARQNQGVALANRFLLGNDLATGRLVQVVPKTADIASVSLGAYVFSAKADRWQSKTIVCFRNWLKQATSALADSSSESSVCAMPRNKTQNSQRAAAAKPAAGQ